MKLLVLLAALVVGPPGSPPPHVSGTSVEPPPAWIEVAASSRWLAFGSYCWSGPNGAACVDMIPPARRTGVPTMRVPRGGVVRLHFRVEMTRATVRLAGETVVRGKGRMVVFVARRSGLLQVDVKARGGTASYLARLRLR